jgi:hypothetical protein
MANLDEESAHRRDLYLHNTEHLQETDIHAPGGIRSCNPNKRSTPDVRLRPRVHSDRWNKIQNPVKGKALGLAAL